MQVVERRKEPWELNNEPNECAGQSPLGTDLTKSKISEQQEEPNRLSVIIMESLILAQDERWRRA